MQNGVINLFSMENYGLNSEKGPNKVKLSFHGFPIDSRKSSPWKPFLPVIPCLKKIPLFIYSYSFAPFQ